nr:BppU family phage baseplate upper protein [Carnobacterium maltaromaticum]
MIRYPFELSTTQRNHVGWLDVRQNDTGTQQFVATITTNDVTQDLTGLTAEFRTRQNDENVIIEKATITNVKNGVVEYVVSQYAMQQLGKNIGYFTFSKGDVEMFSTKDFCYYVNTSVTTFGLKGCDYIWRFEDLLEYVTGLANQSQVQLDKLINDVEGIQQQIDDMFALIESQGVLSADEVRQLMINFMSGQDIEVTVKSDFTGKIAGSDIENANNLNWTHKDSLLSPTGSGWNAASQVYINMLYKLDNVVFPVTASASGLMPQTLIKFNALWVLEQNFPQIFKNATTTEEKVTIARSKITSTTVNAYAKGSGPSGNKVNAQVYYNNAWIGDSTNTSNSISKIGFSQNNPISAPRYIHTDGYCYLLVYGEASNGTIASIASVDYAKFELKVKFNISDFVPTRQEFNAHALDAVKHITAAERTKWNAKQDVNFKQVTGATGLNGWYAYNNTPMLITREGRLVNLVLQLNAGVQTSGTEMLTLPDWAIPQVGGTTLTAMSVSKDWAYKPCTVVVRGNKLIVGANVDNFLTIISVTYIAAA